MSDFSACQALLEKHAPAPRKPPIPASEIRLAVAREAFARNAALRMPHAPGTVRVIHAEYMAGTSQLALAKKLGICRSNLTSLFKRHGLPSKKKKRPVITYKGVPYAFDGKYYTYQGFRGSGHTFLHRVIWEERHGPIPKGHHLVILGKRDDFSDSNLKLMTKNEAIHHALATRWARYKARKEAA